MVSLSTRKRSRMPSSTSIHLLTKNSDDWPVVDPLPSYGRGRELPGGRHRSLIYGRNLTDVIITGDNGTIDGQGSVWWNWFKSKTLNYTRPHLVELMNSTGVVISNLTFLNSPFWTIHPVYCSHVIVQNVTILAPLDSPNTDGIDPDSSDDVCIEDCYISTGDDLIAIKSGWDEYGISFARPSTNIIIRRLTGHNRNGSGIAIGSEMSGGVSEVYAENLYFFDSSTAIIIKTARGRGGYVRNIYISNVTLANVDTAIRFNSNFSQHPDEFYDPNALPVIERITVKDVIGDNIKVAGLLKGIEGDSFHHVCLLNITLNVTSESPWNCSYIQGYSALVSPETCEPLKESIYPKHSSDCYHLSNHLWSSEHKICLEMYVSSSLETSVNFKSKLLLYICLGDGITLENIVGEPENRRLGLESLPLEMSGVVAVPELAIFLSGFIRGPRFVSSGSGFSGSSSTVGFCFISLSLAFSAARRAFSPLRFNSFHGSMFTWKPCFLLVKVEASGSPSILMDNLDGF
ncbi:hypothetical protein CRYUN_Cryun01aG0203200 [Craigia yunnanensis]